MLRSVIGWFLTYPQCTATKERCLEFLQEKKIQEAVVAEELHEDGTPHLHAYVKLDTGVVLKQAPTFFDFDGFHGNYQPARSWRAVQEYVKKDGNFVTYNIDIESASHKRAKRNRELLERPVHELVDEGLISLQTSPVIKRAKLVYEESKNSTFKIDHTQKRGVWIYGPPGVGKSYKVRQDYPDIYIKAQNKWWDGYTGQKTVLMDDFDRLGECLSHYMKIWADVYETTGEVKGGSVNLTYDKLVITSNYSIDEIFCNDFVLRDAIKRRFDIIHYPLKLY